jgi:hypothetical protein
MRNYLQEIELVGAVMVYQEEEQCRWSLDWLYANCNRVCILLDNYNLETEAIVMEYKNKYPEMTHIAYSREPVNPKRNMIQGQIKKRFKQRQIQIREELIIELKKMHNKKSIDLLIWMDSDETFIDEFPKYLEEFWYHQTAHKYMMLGFVEVFDRMDVIIFQRMSPHGRVFKYDPTMTALPWITRTRYFPYYSNSKPWKVRNLVVHICRLTEEYRKRRQFFDNVDFMKSSMDKEVWILPKDVRKMTVEEIAEYQPGPHQCPSKYPSITLREYLINKEKYINN